jgi:hypothetical protein
MELTLVMHYIPLPLNFFYVRSKREMWAAIGSIDRKLSWLKIIFDQQRKS